MYKERSMIGEPPPTTTTATYLSSDCWFDVNEGAGNKGVWQVGLLVGGRRY